MIDDEAEVRWDMAGPRWVARIAGGRTGSRITGACGALEAGDEPPGSGAPAAAARA